MARWLILVLFVGAVVIGCREGDAKPKPIPTPVDLADAAPGLEHDDPAFEPEFGPDRSTAIWGELGGAVYRIEMPKDWNKRLVVFLKNPSVRSGAPVRVAEPENRRALIRAGYAWASSSYGDLYPSDERQMFESAAVWDEFVRRFGRPEYTYVLGVDAGGPATLMSAERLADRYDGALTMCSTDEIPVANMHSDDEFVAAVYAAGIRQAEFDQILRDTPDDLADIVLTRLRGENWATYRELWIALSGGARPLASETFDSYADYFVRRGTYYAERDWIGNRDRRYALGIASVSDEEFNEGVVRQSSSPETTTARLDGQIQIPVMMMATTGGLPALVGHQSVRRRIAAAGKGDLLVQRTVEESRDCAFSTLEYDAALGDLVRWVESGKKPAGEDLLDGDLTDIGVKFSGSPHITSRAGAELHRETGGVTITGRLWVRGNDSTYPYIFVFVENDGLLSDCRLEFSTIDDNVREGNPFKPMPIASDGVTVGCGQLGARLFYQIGIGSDEPAGTRLDSLSTLAWPERGASSIEFDAEFDAANPHPRGAFTMVFGDVLANDGQRMPAGTLIEAFIGETLCGRTSTPKIARRFSDLNIVISGPDLRPGCEEGAEVKFRVNGRRARVDGPPVLNDFDHDAPTIDIIAGD